LIKKVKLNKKKNKNKKLNGNLNVDLKLKLFNGDKNYKVLKIKNFYHYKILLYLLFWKNRTKIIKKVSFNRRKR
jgi:hypothetical protein